MIERLDRKQRVPRPYETAKDCIASVRNAECKRLFYRSATVEATRCELFRGLTHGWSSADSENIRFFVKKPSKLVLQAKVFVLEFR